MRATLASLLLLAAPAMLHAQPAVLASAPEKTAVTVYRDPDRTPGQEIDRDWPQGFAMISETRTVTLPPGKATIRFDGVAESMVAVSAIVTGLPGGVIEKNRNADLLSPAALIDGMLGNRVTISRTNPGSGAVTSEEAIVRTRADGGLVLQTRDGYEAVRCSGVPEKLSVDRVPDGLSANPVFTINVDDPTGGTYTVTLTYLAAGFDWGAHYVGTLDEGGKGDALGMRLMAWLTLANDNGQSFPDAELMAVAGKLNIETAPRNLSQPVAGRPLRLSCYPLGTTTSMPPPPPPSSLPSTAPMMAEIADNEIVVTSMRREAAAAPAPVAMVAPEEELGDLKLYRVPEPLTVAAQSLKQVAFFDRDKVRGGMLYQAGCSPNEGQDSEEAQDDPEPRNAAILFTTKNDKAHGLGVALPMGQMTLFAAAAGEERLLDEAALRDYAVGEDVELALGDSATVTSQCLLVARAQSEDEEEEASDRIDMRVLLTNANSHAVKLRLVLGAADAWKIARAPRGLRLKDGAWTLEMTLGAGRARRIDWRAISAD